MTKTQEKKVSAFLSRLEELRELTTSLEGEIETLKDELQEAYDNKSENWQDSDKGSEFQDIITNLEEAVSALNDGNIGNAQDAIGSISID